ncbi:MAG: response regulator [Desulfobacterales bacterium]|nr:response regulator [Desulfobacterales bacterium]
MAEPLKILVIDDELHIRQSFSDFLEDLGFETILAENGLIGLERLKTEKPDLVLLDLRMPEMDGLEVLQQGKKLLPDTPMIVISGANRIGDVVRALRYGAWDYLEKPVRDFSILGHSVQKAVEKARLIRENKAYQEQLEKKVKERTAELEKANTNLSHINHRLHRIVESTRGLTCCKEMGQFSKMILDEFADQMAATGGSFYMIEGDSLKLMYALDPGHAPERLSFPLEEDSVLKKVIEERNPLLIEDIGLLDDIRSSEWQGYTDGSLLAFPILDTDSKAVGAITLHCKEEPPFVEQDKEIGAILASYSCETLRAVKAFEAVQKSELQYRTLFEKNNDAIFMVERQTGRYLDANQAGLELTGRSLEELNQLTVFDVTPIGAKERFSSLQLVDTPSDFGMVVYERPDHTYRTAKLTVVPLDDNMIIGIAKDITQDLELEKQLRHSRKMEAIGTLAGGIAHDFNNILSGIFGYAQLTEMNLDNPEAARKNLRQVVNGASRAGELVQQILTFSRQAEHERKSLKLYLIVKETVKFLRSSIPSSIEIKEKVNSRSNILADATQIHQVIMNLCTNAYHAIGNNQQGTLTVSLEEVEVTELALKNDCRLGPYLRLGIEDTGNGIDNEILDRIFDPYFTTKEMAHGTGLGLAVVEGIVKSHEGFITVKSAVDQGTLFNVYFPKVAPSQKVDSLNASTADMSGGTGRIMLVEDEASILEATQGILEKVGYQVTGFLDGESAFREFEKDPSQFDLIITDMTMPKMSGRELSRKVLSIKAEMPIILCTGFHETFTREKALKEGISEYVQKPLTGKKLVDIVSQALVNNAEHPK